MIRLTIIITTLVLIQISSSAQNIYELNYSTESLIANSSLALFGFNETIKSNLLGFSKDELNSLCSSDLGNVLLILILHDLCRTLYSIIISHKPSVVDNHMLPSSDSNIPIMVLSGSPFCVSNFIKASFFLSNRNINSIMEKKFSKILKIHLKDNIVVALHDLMKGDTIKLEDDEFKLYSNVAAKHKFSIENLNIGDSVYMYGV